MVYFSTTRVRGEVRRCAWRVAVCHVVACVCVCVFVAKGPGVVQIQATVWLLRLQKQGCKTGTKPATSERSWHRSLTRVVEGHLCHCCSFQSSLLCSVCSRQLITRQVIEGVSSITPCPCCLCAEAESCSADMSLHCQFHVAATLAAVMFA